MAKPPDRSRKVLEELHELLMDNNSSVHFSEFFEISETMMNGYARLVALGHPGQTVALAMLGATINLYEMFGMHEELPELLRVLATRIESKDNPN
ncbi:MAG: hypothetical protein FP826_09010 [Sphingomonadales bacterium]|nr:hypothetical protein [Sphingomonadales bacterium]MBU3993857.1 hypothetical protein [Alphaproteobacteria bacterium]